MQRALARPNDFVNGKPNILLVCPPRLGPVSETYFDPMFGGSEEKSAQLYPYFKAVADKYGVPLFNADEVVKTSAIDGLHLDADQHELLGRALADSIRLHLLPR